MGQISEKHDQCFFKRSIFTASICYDFAEEFWLGLNKTYSITQQGDYILRIELQDWKDNKRYVEYAFDLGGPETDYTLQLSRISGSIPNALPEQTELRFSTADHDMAVINNFNCPENYLGISMPAGYTKAAVSLLSEGQQHALVGGYQYLLDFRNKQGGQQHLCPCRKEQEMFFFVGSYNEASSLCFIEGKTKAW